MRALVIGASGLVGQALVRAAPPGVTVEGTAHAQRVPGLVPLDVTDADAVERLLAERAPDAVLMPAAQPNVDWCEREPAASAPVNAVAPGTVALACAARGVPLVFFSSDYVFDGRDGPYPEDAPPAPICEYGRQKLDAERRVAAALPGAHLVVRTTGVFGREARRKNFLYRAVDTLRRGEPLVVPEDQYGNPTLADGLADATWALIARGARGTVNVVGDAWMSRPDLARRVARAFGLDEALVRGVPTAALGQAAPRPLRAGLTTDRLHAALGAGLPDVDAALAALAAQGLDA